MTSSQRDALIAGVITVLGSLFLYWIITYGVR
jgi:hypothetical protein